MPGHFQRFVEQPAHAVARVEGAERVLKHHLDAAPQLAFFCRRQAQPRLALDMDVAAVRGFQTEDHPRQGGFARAGFTNNAQGFAPAQLQRHLVDHGALFAVRPLEGFAQAVDLQQRRRLFGLGRDDAQRGTRRAMVAAKVHRPARAQQVLGVGMLRVVQHVVDVALLDDDAVVHHRHPVGQPRDHGQVMADDQHRGALAAQGFEQGQHLRLHGGVEGRGGFVGDQQTRVAGDGRSDQRPLAQATGQLIRVLTRA